MISVPSFAVPRLRGSSGSANCLSASSKVTVLTVFPFGRGAKRGFSPQSFSFSPSWMKPPFLPILAKMGFLVFGSMPSSVAEL